MKRALLGLAILLMLTTVAVAEKASIYGNDDGYAWKPTANGEIMNPGHLTAAHKKLPFGTMVEVTNVANGRTVTVRINDRGPFVRGRVIDLTPAGAKAIGLTDDEGVTEVKLRVVSLQK